MKYRLKENMNLQVCESLNKLFLEDYLIVCSPNEFLKTLVSCELPSQQENMYVNSKQALHTEEQHYINKQNKEYTIITCPR